METKPILSIKNLSHTFAHKNFTESFAELFLIFFFFSVFGHFIEILWSVLRNTLEVSTWRPIVNDIIPMAAPYGLGAVAFVMFVFPLVKKYRPNHLIIYFLCASLATFVELLCSLVVVLIYGRNYFWDYSERMINFYGHICLSNFLLFGIAGLLFIYYLYPFYKKIVDRLTKKQINSIFKIVLIAYIINAILVLKRDFF